MGLLDTYSKEPEPAPFTPAEPGGNSSFSMGLKEGVETLARSMGPVGAAAGMVGHIAANIIENPQAYGNLFTAAERQTMLVDTVVSQNIAHEQAYERRIKAVKEATGIELENPFRGGYQDEIRRAARADVAARLQSADQEPPDSFVTGGKIFERNLAEVRAKHPDKIDALTFGSIDAEAQAIAKGSEEDYTRARAQTGLDTPTSLVTQFAGMAWGQRRDPIFVGSMFAGPTSAVGKTVAARIATSGLFQGLYNMGITALEQPVVQAWRQQIGVRSGMMPAIENVGMAFLSGAIPGVTFRGAHEAISAGAREAVERVLAGNPKPGDIDLALKTAGDAMAPQEAAAARVGESMDELERVTQPPVPKDVPQALHDDLVGAAQRYGDDPINSPSPAAVNAVDAIEVYHGSPHDFEAFDVTKIGSGEGAQSYGHGLYFAENQQVARSYKALADAKINGKPFDINDPVHKAVGLVDEFGSRDAAIAEAKVRLARDPDVFNEDVLRRLESDKPLPKLEQGGTLYRARINADREHFIDYDKPLSEQSPYVLDRLRAVADQLNPGAGEQLARSPTKAGDWLDTLSHAEGRAEFSKTLAEAGIPGIKYLDQGSRPGPGGMTSAGMFLNEPPKTRNYVVFDDKLVDITHKNDLPLSPKMQEVADRVAAANPTSKREAQMAASEALEDIGNRDNNTRLRTEIDEGQKFYSLEETFEAPPPEPKSGDVIGHVPWVNEKGEPTTITARQAGNIAKRETELLDVIRECK